MAKGVVMRTFIVYDEQSNTNYSLKFVDDNGNETVKTIDRFYPGEPTTLVLPENPANRKYFSTKKLEEIGENGLELTYKESKTYGPRLPGESSPRKPLEDWLTPDERKQYDELMTIARERRAEAQKKPTLTPVEKAKRAYEKALEAYKKAEAEAAEAK